MPDIVLDQYAPGGCMKQLGDAAGGIVYDQYVPGGAMGQLYETSGMTDPPNQYAPGGVFGQIEQELEGGGSSVPDWVPINAVIHIDLVGGSPQGRAWVDGIGVVAVDTLLGSDPDSESGIGPTSYDPASLMGDGYLDIDPAALIGAAKTALLAGSTFTIKTSNHDGEGFDDNIMVFIFASGGGSTLVQVNISGSNHAVSASTGFGSVELITEPLINGGVVGAKNCTAVTFTSSRLEVAVNGSAAESGSLTTEELPPEEPVAVACFNIHADLHHAVQSITLYDPLPSTDGLSDLSEVT